MSGINMMRWSFKSYGGIGISPFVLCLTYFWALGSTFQIRIGLLLHTCFYFILFSAWLFQIIIACWGKQDYWKRYPTWCFLSMNHMAWSSIELCSQNYFWPWYYSIFKVKANTESHSPLILITSPGSELPCTVA